MLLAELGPNETAVAITAIICTAVVVVALVVWFFHGDW